jgi:hypothetical protein
LTELTELTEFFMKQKSATELRGQNCRPQDRSQTPAEGNKFGNEVKAAELILRQAQDDRISFNIL